MHPRPVRKVADISRWSSVYRCYICERERKKRRDANFIPPMAADYRIFAGISAYAQSTPVCWRHYSRVLDNLLRSMLTVSETGKWHPKPGWTVFVMPVRVDEHGDPYMGRRIFTAFPRS